MKDESNRTVDLIEFNDPINASCVFLEGDTLIVYSDALSCEGVWIGQCDYRMHLSRNQVSALIKHLQRWLSKGTFKYENVRRTHKDAA